MPATNQAERRELRDAVRAFLETAYPPISSESRVGAGAKLDDAVWRRLANEVALTGLVVPEKYDGQGLGVTEAVIALEETARVLFAQPFLTSSVLATLAIKESGDEAAAGELLPQLASGALVATLALDDAADAAVTASEVGGQWQLTGAKNPVLDGAVAAKLVVSAAVGGSVGLFLVDASAASVTSHEGLDVTRGVASVSFSGAPAVRLGGDATTLVARLRDLSAVAASAELTGLADRALVLAVDYAKQREQFGRVIGSFQAVKHICAEMLTVVESSRAACAAAALAADDDPAALPQTASIAKAWTSEQCVTATEQLIQVLGGIGYTWEHPAHLLLRRAHTLAALFGDAAEHRARLAGQLQLS
jgi:alkylation response protein AidB-like acyl-CoA dehydrogenase